MNSQANRLKEQVQILGEREQTYHKQLLVITEAFGALFNSCERVTLKWKELKENEDPAVEKFLDAVELIELRAYLEGLQTTQYRLAPASVPPGVTVEPEADAGAGEVGDNPPEAGPTERDHSSPDQ
jgi:hypothetical protein